MADRRRGLGRLPGPVRRPPVLAILLGNPTYTAYILGNGVSMVGTWMQRVACAWLVWDWTHSGFWLGVLAAADLMPTMVVGPFAGAAADRWSRLALNRLCQTALTVMALVLAALLFADLLGLALLIAFVIVQGCLVALNQPARLALVQELVPRSQLGPAVALHSVNVNLARLLGPAVAGILILRVDIAWVFVANALMTAVFVAVLSGIRLQRTVTPRPPGHVLAQIAAGFRYVAADPSLRLILVVLFLGGAMIRSIAELMPAFAARDFANAATGLATLTSAFAFGAVMAGLSAGSRSDTAALFRSAVLSWCVAAVAALAFGATTAAWLATALAAGMGHFVARGLIATQTFVQLASQDAMRGRTLSVHGLIARGSPSIGALALGLASDHVGLAWAVVAATIAFGLPVLLLLPGIRRIFDELKRQDAT